MVLLCTLEKGSAAVSSLVVNRDKRGHLVLVKFGKHDRF